MKILELRAENFKRLTVVQITPEGHLIQITGANGQGKTSAIDAIWSALGGADAVPDEPIRAGKKQARVEVKLGDETGARLIVERSFTEKGSYLTIKSPDGGKFSKPQQLLDGLMGAIGFDPLQFMRMDAREQFNMLRGIVKIEVDIEALDRKRTTLYETRTLIGRQILSAKSRCEAITVPENLPDEAPDIEALTQRLTSASTHNAAVLENRTQLQRRQTWIDDRNTEIADLRSRLAILERDVAESAEALRKELAKPQPELIDETAVADELRAAREIENGLGRRTAKIDAQAELTTLERDQQTKTDEIADIDALKLKAIAEAKMPVDGLQFVLPEGGSFKDGTVVYKGHPLNQASGAEQLAVSAAIGVALNPKLRVLLCRDGSLLDSKSLAALGAFAEKNDMQVFIERVDESGAIGVVIEDGHVKGQEALVEQFLKEEAEGKTPAAAEAATPDPERAARATAYLDAELQKLAGYTTAAECDKANATVLHMLRAFSPMVAERWAPAYAARIKALTKKK